MPGRLAGADLVRQPRHRNYDNQNTTHKMRSHSDLFTGNTHSRTQRLPRLSRRPGFEHCFVEIARGMQGDTG